MALFKWVQFLILSVNFGRLMAIPDREQTDYCEMLGKDNIQGTQNCIFLFLCDLAYLSILKERNMLFWLETMFTT